MQCYRGYNIYNLKKKKKKTEELEVAQGEVVGCIALHAITRGVSLQQV